MVLKITNKSQLYNVNLSHFIYIIPMGLVLPTEFNYLLKSYHWTLDTFQNKKKYRNVVHKIV